MEFIELEGDTETWIVGDGHEWQRKTEKDQCSGKGGGDGRESEREGKRVSWTWRGGVNGMEWKAGFQARLELQEIIYEPEHDDASAAYDEKSVCASACNRNDVWTVLQW